MQGVLPSNQSVLLTRTVGERCQYFLSHSRKFTEKTYFCWVVVLAFVKPGTLNRKQADEAINPLFNHWHTGVAQTQCVILHKALRRKKVIDARNAYSYKFSTRYSCLFGFFFIKKSQSRGGHHFTSQPPKAPVNVKLLTCSSTFHSYLHSELSGWQHIKIQE